MYILISKLCTGQHHNRTVGIMIQTKPTRDCCLLTPAASLAGSPCMHWYNSQAGQRLISPTADARTQLLLGMLFFLYHFR